MDEVKDVLIVGAGPAGLSAAIYLIRSGYEVTIFEKGFPGGKVNLTAEVERLKGERDDLESRLNDMTAERDKFQDLI